MEVVVDGDGLPTVHRLYHVEHIHTSSVSCRAHTSLSVPCRAHTSSSVSCRAHTIMANNNHSHEGTNHGREEGSV